jgi:sugar/nucleoside kinase (ribokinase family)
VVTNDKGNESGSVATGLALITLAHDSTGKHTIVCHGENDACGPREISAVDSILTERPRVGILLMQNSVNATANVRVAKLAHTARKLVVFKASPVFASSDVPDQLWPLVDVLVVNEFEAPILLGWRDGVGNGVLPLRTLGDCRRAAFELQVCFIHVKLFTPLFRLHMPPPPPTHTHTHPLCLH